MDNEVNPKKHTRGLLCNIFKQLACVSRFSFFELNKFRLVTESRVNEVPDVRISKILEHEAGLVLECILEQDPWPTRNAKLDIGRWTDILN